MRTFLRRAARLMIIFLSAVLVCLLLAAGVLFILSPGTPAPYLDESGVVVAGSITEKISIPVHGTEQGMFLRGRDSTKPVLLFVHGGPAMPEYALSRNYTSVLEELFVVCWWEQRGGGLSFDSDIAPETITAEQLIEDTRAVTEYLLTRFGRKKIYLMGHSWGSFIGMQAAARTPELYEAYIGIGQISRQWESEKLAYAYMLRESVKRGNEGMHKKLVSIPLPDMDHMPKEYRSLRDEAMHELGIGTTRDMRSVIHGIFMPVMLCSEYTLGEKIDIWRGKWSASSTELWTRLLATDLTVLVPALSVPVYFLHGMHDYTVSYTLAEDYFSVLQAPGKGYYTFRQSAHSPLFEEPDRMRRILKEDVLAGKFDLAD